MIFEYYSTKVQPNTKLNNIQTAVKSTKITRTNAIVGDTADCSALMRIIQGMLLHANHSSESYLLPVAPLLLEAMQRMVNYSKPRDLPLSNRRPYPNEYLISCFVVIIHLIEEKHRFNVQVAKAACSDGFNSAKGQIHSLTASQLLDTIEWFVHRDSFDVQDSQQSVADISFVFNQVSFVSISKLFIFID
mmetsp:Transcript_22150/g.31827  ORF Transcript_22150/g.31827 Transcript_22150/m.31827 type:complete len:190 (+) Transcript_22150:820-1389(+)